MLQELLRRLDLSDNRLTGSIPVELGNRVRITHFDLSNNDLTGTIPGELGNLSELNSLSISGNPLAGPLPRELIGLPLTLFHWHDTDLCAPADDDFQEWLDSIEDHRGNGNCDS